nr:hypothetical protein KPHV_24900 [Kitasatospora purpeofusca]
MAPGALSAAGPASVAVSGTGSVMGELLPLGGRVVVLPVIVRPSYSAVEAVAEENRSGARGASAPEGRPPPACPFCQWRALGSVAGSGIGRNGR